MAAAPRGLRWETGLNGQLSGLRTELKGDIAALGDRMDRVMDGLIRHTQEGHPPHQAA